MINFYLRASVDLECWDGRNLAPYGEIATIYDGFYTSQCGAGFRPTVPFLWVTVVDDIDTVYI